MAENDQTPATPDPTGPAADETRIEASDRPEAPVAAAPAPVATATGPRLRDTVWNFRSMVLVAVASLLIGGMGGAAVVAAADEDHGDRARIAFITGNGDGRFGEDDNRIRPFRQDGSAPDDGNVTPGGPGSAPDPGSAG